MALFVFCRGGGAGVSACSFFSPTGPLTSPMHANWQARFLAGLAGAAKATKVQLVDAHFANRVIGGVSPQKTSIRTSAIERDDIPFLEVIYATNSATISNH